MTSLKFSKFNFSAAISNIYAQFAPVTRGIISTTGNKGIEEISCKHPLEIGRTTWIHNDLEIYSTLRSM